MEQIVGKLDDGTVALVAMAYEEDQEVLDEKLAKFDAVIARFDAAVVAEEVIKAREVQLEMERLARVELRKQKSDDFKAKLEARRADMEKRFKEYCDSIENDPNF